VRRAWLFALLVIPLLVTACAPGTEAGIAAPTFTVLQSGTGFRSVDPPGVGAGDAVFDVRLRATNPNPIGFTLASLDGDFFLGGHPAATTTFRHGIELPAHGSSDLTLEIRVPLAQAPALLQTLAGLLTGASTSYRVDATVGVRVFGAVRRFPRATLAQGSVRWSPAWVAPRIQLASSGPSLHVDSLTRVTVQIAATLYNPASLGYVVQAPTVHLAFAGTPVATAQLGRVVAPAGATGPRDQTFSFNPLQVGPALAAQISAVASGAGSLAFGVSGPLVLEAPGLATHHVDAAALLSGTLR
jgi:hypothetical protein